MDTDAKRNPQPPRKRRVLGLGDLTEQQIEAIRKSEVPKKYAYLNEELKD